MKRLVSINHIRPGHQAIGIARKPNGGTRQRAIKAANRLFEKGE